MGSALTSEEHKLVHELHLRSSYSRKSCFPISSFCKAFFSLVLRFYAPPSLAA